MDHDLNISTLNAGLVTVLPFNVRYYSSMLNPFETRNTYSTKSYPSRYMWIYLYIFCVYVHIHISIQILLHCQDMERFCFVIIMTFYVLHFCHNDVKHGKGRLKFKIAND